MYYAGGMLAIINFFFTLVIGLYFWNLLKNQQSSKVSITRESRKEQLKLDRMRAISLTEPLAEKTRPLSFDEIIGQDDAVKALKAVLCSSNPGHVIIYGPPGVGKTAAARVVLEEAKKTSYSPFNEMSKFVELDATTARFDDRGIADPLIGSVHDPIYQGAGPLGVTGVPQPKPGAVTKAHGGLLFIDEIGELHPVQMNKLLKVLEDRKVFLDSAYYSSEDRNIPDYIHDIFQNGLPADFRLVAATTRSPETIPPAIRSRCVEVYFSELKPSHIATIGSNASNRAGFSLGQGVLDTICKYAVNGRDAVNMIQMSGGLSIAGGRDEISISDIEWVIRTGQLNPRPERMICEKPHIGLVNGLAVYGTNMGALVEIEVSVIPVSKGTGKLTTTGVIEEEETGIEGRKLRRKSMAKGSIDNVLTVLNKEFDLDTSCYDIHINFPGGIPMDGSSAGVALVTAIYSAITEKVIDNYTAMTGEISIRGLVKPVGGIVPKVEAARQAGVKKVFIPQENWQSIFDEMDDIKVVGVTNINEVVFSATEIDESKSVEESIDRKEKRSVLIGV